MRRQHRNSRNCCKKDANHRQAKNNIETKQELTFLDDTLRHFARIRMNGIPPRPTEILVREISSDVVLAWVQFSYPAGLRADVLNAEVPVHAGVAVVFAHGLIDRVSCETRSRTSQGKHK